jgi:hypothetical protein
MSNIWTDQPVEADGVTILHIGIGPTAALQVQVNNIGAGLLTYAATVGGLFGSTTFVGADLETVLKQAHKHIKSGA